MRTALTISALAHSLLWVPLVWPGATLPEAPPENPIVVDIVSSAEVPESPKAELPEPPKAERAAEPAPAKADVQERSSSAKPAPQPSSSPPVPSRQREAAQQRQQTSQQRQQAPQPEAAPSSPQGTQAAATPTPALPTPAPTMTSWLDSALSAAPVSASAFDPTENPADLAKEDVADFKSHLQACWKPPADLAEARNLMVVLRVSLNQSGALSAEPTLIAASASAQGPALIETAKRALRDCQPYAFLPANKYKEWKLLDLGFAPSGLTVLPNVLSAGSHLASGG